MEQAATLATDNGNSSNTTGCSKGTPTPTSGTTISVVGAAQPGVSGAQLLSAAAPARKPPDRFQPQAQPRQRLLLPRPPSPPPPVLQAVTPPTATMCGPPVSAAAAEEDAQGGHPLQSRQAAAHQKWLQSRQAAVHRKWQALQGTGPASDVPFRVAGSWEVLRQVGQQGVSSSMLRVGVAMGPGRRKEPVTAIRKGGFLGEGKRSHPHDQHQQQLLEAAPGPPRQDQSLGAPPPPPLDSSNIPSVAMPFFAPRAPQPQPQQPDNASALPLASPAESTLGFHNNVAVSAAAAAAAAAQQQQSSSTSREEGGIVALEDLVDDSPYWPYYMYDDDHDHGSKAPSRLPPTPPPTPPGHATGGTLAVDRAPSSSQNGPGRRSRAAMVAARAAAAIAASCLPRREEQASRLTGSRPVRTCCHRRCSKKWPLEKLAQARSGVPAGVTPIHGPPPSDNSNSAGGGGDDGGRIRGCDGALRKAYLKGCFSRDGGLLYITAGRSSLPVCPLFFSAVTGIPAGVVESAVKEFLRGTKRRSFSRSPRISIAPARRALSPSPSPREPVPAGWWCSTATERWYSRTTERCSSMGVDYSNHQLPCESSKAIQAFITDLASHWQPLEESSRVEMSYPSRKAVYDLFMRDWEGRAQDGVAGQPSNLRACAPTPSYGVFVATWDRWCGHVGLKQSGQHEHEHGHEQQQQQQQRYHHRHHYQEHQQLLQQQHLQQQHHYQEQDHYQQQHRHPHPHPQQQHPQHYTQQQQERQPFMQQWRHQQQQQQLQQLHNLFQQQQERQQQERQQQERQQQQQQQQLQERQQLQQQQQQQQPRLQVPIFPQGSMILPKPTTKTPAYKAAAAANSTVFAAVAAAAATAAPAAAAVVGGAAAEVEASEAPKPLAVPLLPAELQVDLAPSKSP